MFIYFRCRRCRKVHSAEARRADSPFICPSCRNEFLVPSVSEPGCVPAPAAIVAVPPIIPSPAITTTPPPALSKPAAPPLLVRRPRLTRRQLLVSGAAALVLLLGGLVLGAILSRSTLDTSPSEKAAADGADLSAEERGAAAAANVPPVGDEQEAPVGLVGRRTPLGKLHPAPLREERQEPDKEPIQEIPPARAPEPKRDPAPAPVPVKRRQNLSEEELVKQLARVPEIGIPPTTVPALLQAYQNDFQARQRVSGGISLEPTVLLQIRPDLKGLPVRQGRACQLDAPAAVTLQTLSQKLRIYLQAAAPRDAEGKRSSPALLRQALRLEMRGQRPEWLRAEAIPTMHQLLMHEDLPLRLMLVDLLAEIKGSVSTAALAQRAVFDLSPEVRTAATDALKERPREEARPWLLHGLRYPWAPAANHAAEALIALDDQETVPQLVSLLKQPDAAGPTPSGSGYLVREVVRANHLSSCLLCHPPGRSGNEPVLGLDPVVRVPGLAAQVSAVQRLQATPGAHGYGGGGATLSSSPAVTARVVPVPLLIRGDVTYLRQDFSVQLPVPQPGVPVPQNQRFDYLVRARPATAEELTALKERRGQRASYPQRDAVLFALRELTGQDPGPSTESWQQLYPRAESDLEAARLSAQLLQAPPHRLEQWLTYLRDSEGGVYTQALAGAIPRLAGPDQERARETLVERLARMNADTLRDKLVDDSAEVRRAAILACGSKSGLELVPDLAARLEDVEPGVVQSARAVLRGKTGKDLGTVAAWREWWNTRNEE